MAKTRKSWNMCPNCHCMIYAVGTGKHRCHQKVLAQIDAELDMTVDEQMESFDKDVKAFWKSKDVKFYKYLAKNDII